MAYPEPIPVIRRKEDVKEFHRRLKSFKLTSEQRKLYEEALVRYKREHAAESEDPDD